MAHLPLSGSESWDNCSLIPGSCRCHPDDRGYPLQCHHQNRRYSCPRIRSSSLTKLPISTGMEVLLGKVTVSWIGVSSETLMMTFGSLLGNLISPLDFVPQASNLQSRDASHDLTLSCLQQLQ